MSGTSAPVLRRHAIRLTIPCDCVAVRLAVVQVRAFLVDQGLVLEEAAACELALAEGCNNAVEHAPAEARELPVVLEAVCDSEGVELRVEDHTAGFDWPEVVELPDDESEGGRGVYLITSLVDEVHYLRGRRGNVLVMRRRRAGLTLAGEVEIGARCRALEQRLVEDERVIRDMADELSSCYESLAAIFRYSGEQGGQDRIEDFAGRLLRDLLGVTGNEWYVFRLLRPESRELVVFACSQDEVALEPLLIGEVSTAGDALEVRSATEHRDTWFEDTTELQVRDPLVRLGSGGAGFVHPVYLGDTLVGTLAVGGRVGGRRFTAAQMSVVQTFADFLAVQVVNARFQEERVRNLLVAQELRIARQIQRSLLPEILPQPSGVALAGRCDSANEVGGDFYDVVPLSEGLVLVVVADVMGKGLPAAMFALMLRGLVRALRDHGRSPRSLLARANELLYDELSRVEMFITAQVACVDATNRRVVVASAGHCPALVAQGGGGLVAAISPDGLPLGVLAGTQFEEETFELAPGTRCLMYTDGLTETPSAGGGGLYGQKRLMDWLASVAPGTGVEAMKTALVDELARFRNDLPLRDDQTFVIVGG